MRTVPVLSCDIPIPLAGGFFAMSIFEVRFEIVGPCECGSLAPGHPALVQAVLVLLVDGLFVAFLVLLALEAFLLACLFIDAARIAASKLILGDDDFTVDTGLAIGIDDGLGFERATEPLTFIGSSGYPVMRSSPMQLRCQHGPFRVVVLELIYIVVL